MFKKLSAIVLALCLCVAMASCTMKKKDDKSDSKKTTTSSQTASTDEEEEEEVPEFEYSFGGGEATLVAYHGEAEEIDLTEGPVLRYRKKTDTYEEYDLAAVSAGAFKNCESVKRVVLPDTVTKIGEACFQNCVNLEEVVLPAGLTEIPDQTFYGCDSLTTVNIPETVETVGLFAFGDYFKRTPWYENQKDGDVIVGDGILLKHNGNAASVNYGETVKKVAYYAFLESTTAEAFFGNCIEEIDSLAMYRSATKVMLPNGSKLVAELKGNNVPVGTYAAAGAPETEEAEETEASEESEVEEAAETEAN